MSENEKAVLTREEYAANLDMVPFDALTRRLWDLARKGEQMIAHDAALRAEIERLKQESIEARMAARAFNDEANKWLQELMDITQLLRREEVSGDALRTRCDELKRVVEAATIPLHEAAILLMRYHDGPMCSGPHICGTCLTFEEIRSAEKVILGARI